MQRRQKKEAEAAHLLGYYVGFPSESVKPC